MPKYVVRPGDCIATIAAESGTTASALLDRGANSDLKELRTNPHVLCPGDIVDIPDPPSGVAISSGGTHNYSAAVPTAGVRVRILDPRHEPVKNRSYELSIGVRTLSGTTDGDGFVDVTIRLHEREARLRIALDADGLDVLEIPILFGHLDPVDTSSGALQRLQNMGYRNHSATTEESIRELQRREGLEVTGAFDDATMQKLVELHGS